MATVRGRGLNGVRKQSSQRRHRLAWCLGTIQSFTYFKIGKQPADFMATRRSNGIAAENVIGDLPLELYNLIRLDNKGCSIERNRV